MKYVLKIPKKEWSDNIYLIDALVGRGSSTPSCNSETNRHDNAHETKETKEVDIGSKNQATTAIDEYREI